MDLAQNSAAKGNCHCAWACINMMVLSQLHLSNTHDIQLDVMQASSRRSQVSFLHANRTSQVECHLLEMSTKLVGLHAARKVPDDVDSCSPIHHWPQKPELRLHLLTQPSCAAQHPVW
jgi:hypothetical protein